MNFKCFGCFGGLPNAFNIGTPTNPFFQGTTPTLTVTVLNSAGAPIDITGAKIYLTCKADPADADPGLFQLATGGKGIVLATQSGPTLGQYIATFPSAATAALSALLSYPYTSRVILAGNVQDVLYGNITLSQAITQATT